MTCFCEALRMLADEHKCHMMSRKDAMTVSTPQHAYSIKKFCELNSVSRAFLYKLISQGKGPRTFKVGRRTLISAEEGSRWRASLESIGELRVRP